MTTKIEWADNSLNGIYGCTKCSPGCDHCFSLSMSHRQVHMGNYPAGITEKISYFPGCTGPGIRWTGKVVTDEARMVKAFKCLPIRKPARVFAFSMADLFHPQVSDSFRDRFFELTQAYAHHTYLVLTKREDEMVQYFSADEVYPLPNVQLGLTICNQEEAIRKLPAFVSLREWVLFLSVEPILGPVDISPWLGPFVCGEPPIDQIICGAETGPGKRDMDLAWARNLRDQCQAAGVPFFFKKDSNGSRLLDGQEWSQYPEVIG